MRTSTRNTGVPRDTHASDNPLDDEDEAILDEVWDEIVEAGGLQTQPLPTSLNTSIDALSLRL